MHKRHETLKSVEITPEMKQAGGMLLTGWESEHPGMPYDDDMAEAVFLAMLQVYLDRSAS